MGNIAMIFAGGKGVRMGSGIPKQFLAVQGKPRSEELRVGKEC